MEVQIKSVGNDVHGAASLRTGDTASGRGGSKATQIVNMRKPCKMFGTNLRVGSVNVTSMRKRIHEVADMMARRKLDFCCVQETKWKGESAMELTTDKAKCKFIRSGCDDDGTAGVGVLVAEQWFDSVREVRSVTKRLMIVKVTIGKLVMNLISVYAPQAGRSADEKEEFIFLLQKVLSSIDDREGMIFAEI